jgi:hypothetical protein
MRHYFSVPRPIPSHPGGVHPPAPRGSLPASARSVQGLAARLSGAIAVAETPEGPTETPKEARLALRAPIQNGRDMGHIGVTDRKAQGASAPRH